MIKLVSERMKCLASPKAYTTTPNYSCHNSLQSLEVLKPFQQSGKNTQECLSYRMQSSAYHSCLTFRRWRSDLGFFPQFSPSKARTSIKKKHEGFYETNFNKSSI